MEKKSVSEKITISIPVVNSDYNIKIPANDTVQPPVFWENNEPIPLLGNESTPFYSGRYAWKLIAYEITEGENYIFFWHSPEKSLYIRAGASNKAGDNFPDNFIIN